MNYDQLAKLGAFLQARQSTPFQWGVSDCACLIFDAVKATHGIDLIEDLRGKWHDPRSAARVFNAEGGWEGLAEKRFAHDVPMDAVCDGDVVLLESNHCAGMMQAAGGLGIVFSDVVVSQGEEGLVVLPLSAASRAWGAVWHG